MNPTPSKSPNAENPAFAKSFGAAQEEKILGFWRDQNIFEKTLAKDSPKGEYNFFEGPPTANGRPGIHHVEARSFKDVIPRYKTMQGFHVRRKAGWDTHGLPVELQVEKALGLKSKKEIETYGVAEFNRKCKESVWLYKDEWEKLTERMAFWVDMKNPYVTYENSYIEALWATVKRADERGHLYRDFKIVPWCTRCGTSLATHELNQPGAYKEVKDLSVYVKFKLKSNQKIGYWEVDDNTYILAWTTTPWTLPGNVALAVGPTIDYVLIDYHGKEKLIVAKEIYEKYSQPGEMFLSMASFGRAEFGISEDFDFKGVDLVGLEYESLFPFMNDLLPEHQHAKKPNAYKVYAADFVTTTDGTGIVHTAVMYGADDFEMGTKYELPKFHLVNEEGKFIAGCDTDTLKLSGRYVKESDEKGKPTLAVDIIDNLTARGLLFKKENYVHSYPHCWRCDTPLIYYARTSWYFNMSKLREQLLAANEKINWEPEHIKEGRFGEWLDGIKDWAISRDRYWGTPLPVWETGDKKHKVVIGSLADIRAHVKKSGNTYYAMRHGQAGSNVTKTWDFENDPKNMLTDEGREQVRLSAEGLKDVGIDMIVASPLIRTQQTAQIVAETIGFTGEIITEDNLREFNPGAEYQGLLIHDYIKKFKHYPERFLAENPHGETYSHIRRRVMGVIEEYENVYQDKKILFVTHGSPILNLILGVTGIAIKDIADDVETMAYPKNAEVRKLDYVPFPHNEDYELDFHNPYIDAVELELDGHKLYRTPEVMDVWFDSGSMPIAQDHVLGEPVNFDPKPADYIAEGVDQTRGWFYTMHAVSNMLHDAPTPAYLNAICMGLLMDEKGVKMSKSRGNIVEPWEMFNKYGADVVRFWFYSVNQPGDSKNFDEKALDEVNKKVFNLLRNVVTFYETYKDVQDFSTDEYNPYGNPNVNVLDLWILAKFNDLSKTVTEGLERYQPLEPSRAIREFIGDFSTWYIRRSRDRFKSDDTLDRGMALRTTRIILKNLSAIMAPFTPFISEEIWQKTNWHEEEDWRSVHMSDWPYQGIDRSEYFGEVIEKMDEVRKVVTLGLDARQKANVKVRQPLAKISVSATDLGSEYLDIIKEELNVKEVAVDENLNGSVVLDTEITDELRAEGDMRELVRSIQEMRKEAGLVPSDRITVSLNQEEPAWYQTYAATMKSSVGAQDFVWNAETPSVSKIS